MHYVMFYVSQITSVFYHFFPFRRVSSGLYPWPVVIFCLSNHRPEFISAWFGLDKFVVKHLTKVGRAPRSDLKKYQRTVVLRNNVKHHIRPPRRP